MIRRLGPGQTRQLLLLHGQLTALWQAISVWPDDEQVVVLLNILREIGDEEP